MLKVVQGVLIFIKGMLTYILRKLKKDKKEVF